MEQQSKHETLTHSQRDQREYNSWIPLQGQTQAMGLTLKVRLR
jgi:hypothetical protein